MTSFDEVLRLDQVSKTYASRPPVHALRTATVGIRAGEHLSIMGKSGSGKSTMLSILGLLSRPTSGRVFVDGVDTTALPDHEISRLRGAQLGFVFQAFHLLNGRTAAENVELPLLYDRRSRRERVRLVSEALEKVELTHRRDATARQLSGGERQRVAIARAIVRAPRLLLCDEPTGNLDEQSADRVLQSLLTLNIEGVALVIVTHAPEVAALAPRCLTLVDGRMSADLTAAVTGE